MYRSRTIWHQALWRQESAFCLNKATLDDCVYLRCGQEEWRKVEQAWLFLMFWSRMAMLDWLADCRAQELLEKAGEIRYISCMEQSMQHHTRFSSFFFGAAHDGWRAVDMWTNLLADTLTLKFSWRAHEISGRVELISVASFVFTCNSQCKQPTRLTILRQRRHPLHHRNSMTVPLQYDKSRFRGAWCMYPIFDIVKRLSAMDFSSLNNENSVSLPSLFVDCTRASC